MRVHSTLLSGSEDDTFRSGAMLRRRPPGLQYGAWHQYAGNGIAQYYFHMRLISELRLYKIEQCWHLPETTPLRGNFRQCSIL
jgi:hypothetical protein